MVENTQYVPCYRLRTRYDSVIVKGDINKHIEDKGFKWKILKSGKQALYGGKYRIFIEEINPKIVETMQYIFDNNKYDPTTI